MQIAVLGIDVGKNSCSIAGMEPTGRIVLRRRLHRDSVVKLASRLPACVMAMEACCGAHHLRRVLQAYGHEIRLMSPEYMQPYVKAQKKTSATPKPSPKRRPGRRCGLSSSNAMTSSTCRAFTGPVETP